VPVHVTRTQSYGVLDSQKFAVVVEGADSSEMRQENGKNNGYIFVSSHLPEEQIQSLQQETDKLIQTINRTAK